MRALADPSHHRGRAIPANVIERQKPPLQNPSGANRLTESQKKATLREHRRGTARRSPDGSAIGVNGQDGGPDTLPDAADVERPASL